LKGESTSESTVLAPNGIMGSVVMFLESRDGEDRGNRTPEAMTRHGGMSRLRCRTGWVLRTGKNLHRVNYISTARRGAVRFTEAVVYIVVMAVGQRKVDRESRRKKYFPVHTPAPNNGKLIRPDAPVRGSASIGVEER